MQHFYYLCVHTFKLEYGALSTLELCNRLICSHQIIVLFYTVNQPSNCLITSLSIGQKMVTILRETVMISRPANLTNFQQLIIFH